MLETELLKRIQVRASSLGWRLLRNNVGLAWTGTVYRTGAPDTILLRCARRIRSGLCVGSSDLIGWREVTITPAMVGTKVAVFSALEVKTKTGKLSPQQFSFIDAVRKAGGYARVVRAETEL